MMAVRLALRVLALAQSITSWRLEKSPCLLLLRELRPECLVEGVNMTRGKSLACLNTALTLLLIASGLVAAHDMWLVPTLFSVAPGARVTVMMNTGDTFPNSEGAVKPERIERAAVVTSKGMTRLMSFRTEGTSTLVDVFAPREDGGAIVEVVLKPIATKQPRASFDEFVKHEGLDAIAAQLARAPERRVEERRTYAKYAKTLLRIGQGRGAAKLYQKPLGHRLEIVAEADPFPLKPGGAFPVRLLFDGKPLVGARIVTGSSATATATQSQMRGVRTDSQGRARLQLDGGSGAHYVHALHMIAATGRSDVEWDSFWATLTFGVSQLR